MNIQFGDPTPRMTFEEACGEIKNLLARLRQAPAEKYGTRINGIWLFGSALRDVNVRATIGDLDLLIEPGYARDESLSLKTEWDKFESAWRNIVCNDDCRISFNDLRDFGAWVILRASQPPDPVKPFVLMRIWQHEEPRYSSIANEEWAAMDFLEKWSLDTQQRTKKIAQIRDSETVPRRPAHADNSIMLASIDA